jgi:hypothetical protein
MVTCGSCASKLFDNSRFCSACGQPVSASDMPTFAADDLPTLGNSAFPAQVGVTMAQLMKGTSSRQGARLRRRRQHERQEPSHGFLRHTSWPIRRLRKDGSFPAP